MAHQRFSPIFREALRKAHGNRCIYCERDLLFVETKVDHVLPESFLKDKKALEKLRQRFGLPDSFDILGHENLAPSCEPCNGKKSDLLLMEGFIPIILSRVQKQLPKLRKLLERREAEINLDKVLRTVAVAVDRGLFTKSALLDALNKSIEEEPQAEPVKRKVVLRLFPWRRSGLRGLLRGRPQSIPTDRTIDLTALYDDILAAVKEGHRQLYARRIGATMYELVVQNDFKVVYSIQGEDVLDIWEFRHA